MGNEGLNIHKKLLPVRPKKALGIRKRKTKECNCKAFCVTRKHINLPCHDKEINLDNIPNFLTSEKSQDSLFINVLNNKDINEEISVMVEKND